MNFALLDSFGQNYPQESDGVLDCNSFAVTCSFNRWGSLLAIGCNDGRVVIVDFITRGIAKTVCAHVHPVCCVSWSRNGKKLVTSSTDNTIAVWDVLTGDCEFRYTFDSPVVKVQFHPRNLSTFLVCPLKRSTILITINKEVINIPVDDEPEDGCVATFDRKGRYFLIGTSKGKISVFDTDRQRLVASFRLPSGHPIKAIVFARRDNYFLVNSGDRVIRVYNCDRVVSFGINSELEPLQKLQDLVNKTPWKSCCFSGDAEYVCAGSAKQHAIYIWERNSGSLVKILHGAKGENLLDIEWHPLRPVICSVSNGLVSIWSQSHVENWSAFAPDFKELEENVEYEERESEFDLEDEDKSVELNAERANEDIEVDVLGNDPSTSVLDSSDEEGEANLWYLPVAPEIENPEDPATVDDKFQSPMKGDHSQPPLKRKIRPSESQPSFSDVGGYTNGNKRRVPTSLDPMVKYSKHRKPR